MSCRRFRKTLLDYAEGRLDTAGNQRIESHVSSCDGCRRALYALSASASALDTLRPLTMPPEAASRVSSGLAAAARGDAKAPRAARVGFSFPPSPRVLAGVGTGLAIVLVAVLVIVAYTGPPQTDRRKASDGHTSLAVSSPAGSSTPGQSAEGLAPMQALPRGAAAVLPVVKVSDEDYDENTLRSAFDTLEVKKQVEATCTMGHAISMGSLFRKKLADLMVDAGCDGAMLEAMITYLTNSEPVLLPYYAENARFSGQAVYIIGLAGPRRMGETTKLNRTEVWVMNPDRFAASPDSSVVFFLETRLE